MASTFKWLLGLRGLAVTYLSPALREKFAFAGVGWYSVKNALSANRFTEYELKPGAACLVAGMPNFASLYAIDASLRYLQSLDLDAEQQRTNGLSRNLRARLAALGLPLLTPAGEAFISGIVSLQTPIRPRIPQTNPVRRLDTETK